MTTSKVWMVMIALAGCGSVMPKEPATDAHTSGGGDDDTGACDDPTSVDSCGESCVACTVATEREVPTCDGTACGSSCRDDAPRCSDGSCSQLGFDFDDGTLQGAAVRAPADLALSARQFGSESALAMDVTDLTEVSFTVPICVGGDVDFRGRILHARVFFDGGTDTGEQYYVQATVPDPETGAALGQLGVASGAWVTLDYPLGTSAMAGATTTITFQAGTFGAQFTGAIYFDSISIE